MSGPSAESEHQPWPRYVRVLAVLHVLSIPLGFLGFLGMCAAAGAAYLQRGGFDARVVSMLVAALMCPVLGAAYRRWFENFGRKRWPDGKFNSSARSAS